MFYNAAVKPAGEFNHLLIWPAALLIAFGFVMIYSASLAIAEADRASICWPPSPSA